MTNLEVDEYRARCTGCHNVIKIAGDDTGSVTCPCEETNLHVKPTYYELITQVRNMFEDLTVKRGFCPTCNDTKNSFEGTDDCDTCGHVLYNPKDLDPC